MSKEIKRAKTEETIMTKEDFREEVVFYNYNNDFSDERLKRGYPLQIETVGDLLDIITNFPNDTKISLGGDGHYLYIEPDGSILIDTENYI